MISEEILTPQFLIFETIVLLTIILSCFFIFRKTRALYELSLEKGIRYFSNAFLYYTLTFSIILIFVFGVYINPALFLGSSAYSIIAILLFGIAQLYLALMGGYYLVYSLVWRRFEKRLQDAALKAKTAVVNIIALAIAVIELYLALFRGWNNQYIFFGVLMLGTIFALILRYRTECRKGDRECRRVSRDPFVSSVALAFSIYLAFFIEGFLTPFLYQFHYYIWGIVAMFFVAVHHNVSKSIK